MTRTWVRATPRQDPGICAVSAREYEFVEEPGGAAAQRFVPPPTGLLGRGVGADHDASRHRDCTRSGYSTIQARPSLRVQPASHAHASPASATPLQRRIAIRRTVSGAHGLPVRVHHAGAGQQREPRGRATGRRPRRRYHNEVVRSARLQPGEFSWLLCELLRLGKQHAI